MSKKSKNSKKLDRVKVPGKGTLNQKHSVFEDKRTKRNRTRQAQDSTAIKESKEDT